MDSKEIFSAKNQTAWNTLGKIWKVMGTSEGSTLIKTILRNEGLHTSQLMEKSGVSPAKTFPKLKALVALGILKREVDQKRNVTYKITDLGVQVLDTGVKIAQELLRKQ